MRRLEFELVRSCHNCAEFSGGRCAKVDDAVPDWFQVFGCDEFRQDVPF